MNARLAQEFVKMIIGNRWLVSALLGARAHGDSLGPNDTKAMRAVEEGVCRPRGKRIAAAMGLEVSREGDG